MLIQEASLQGPVKVNCAVGYEETLPLFCHLNVIVRMNDRLMSIF